MTKADIILGTFRKENKNRFLCQVAIDGKEVECYIPSSCRLSNFFNPEGKIVALNTVQSKTARTKYAVYAVKIGRRFIPVNLSNTNRIIEEAITGRRFTFLGSRERVYREHTIDGYKCDLFIEDTKTIVEIKSILSFDNMASFPTVYSERGITQLKQILELQKKGYRICYFFVAMNDKVKSISLNRKNR